MSLGFRDRLRKAAFTIFSVDAVAGLSLLATAAAAEPDRTAASPDAQDTKPASFPRPVVVQVAPAIAVECDAGDGRLHVREIRTESAITPVGPLTRVTVTETYGPSEKTFSGIVTVRDPADKEIVGQFRVRSDMPKDRPGMPSAVMSRHFCESRCGL